MMYLVWCPECDTDLLIPEDTVGRQLVCKRCHEPFEAELEKESFDPALIRSHVVTLARGHVVWMRWCGQVTCVVSLFIGGLSVIQLLTARQVEILLLAVVVGVALLLLSSGLMIFAARSMRRLENHSLCVLGALCMCMPGLCVFFPLSAGAGVWTLTCFLFRPEVRWLFAHYARQDTDAI